MDEDINILVGTKWEEDDKELFFGPLKATDMFLIVEPMSMAHLLSELQLFPSIGQAKKAGWDRPIPTGYSEYIIGKYRTKLCILYMW